MWTEDKLKEFTRECVDKYPHSPSAIVLKSFYLGNDTTKDIRFEHQRAIVEREIQIYKQKI